MAKGYWIGHMDILNPEPYRDYVPASTEVILRHNGRFLARGGKSDTVEGSTRSRHVIVEFPSYAEAVDCYNSAEYAKARAIRQPHSEGEVVIVEGVPD